MFPSVLSVILLCTTHSFVLCLNEEGSALLSLTQSISQDPNGSLSNWNSSDENPCSWNGITCRNGSVISISMSRNGLVGSVSPSLGALPYLRHINLRNNKLYGSLPPELFSAKSLQSLVLYGNSLSGPLPSEIGNLKYLQFLYLSQNALNGTIPSTLLECRRLKALNFAHNNFTGSLPVGFGSSLVALEKLDLSHNKLNGSIPSDIGNLSNLQGTLDLSYNVFSGQIPLSLGNLPERVYIDLTHNNLHGPVPQNGALVNRGPTAFIGNPGLCGPPLKNQCPSSGTAASPTSSSFPYLPNNSPSSDNGAVDASTKHGFSKRTLIAIVACDVVGMGLIGLVFFYCYMRLLNHKNKNDGRAFDKGWKGRRECMCFRKDESETLSENIEQFDLVPLDMHIGFDLDELLKASAFVLGKSGIGIVYKVVLEDGLTLAVRRLGEGGSQRFKEFQTEVEAIGKLRHPNIVTLRAYYWSVDEKLLIYDYIPNGNLASALHGRSGMVAFSPLSWNIRLKIMKGIAKGLVCLHEFSPKKYVHGDLKPNNILLGLNMEPYVSDFGLGRLANIAGGLPAMQSNHLIGDKQQNQTPEASVNLAVNTESCYQAPEALKVLKPSQKWDVYSYGVILLEMLSGRSPVVLLGTSDMDLVRWFQYCIEEKKPLAEVLDPFLGQEPEREEEIVAVLKIALACVQTNSERRPSMHHVSDVLDRFTTIGL